jgi:hypothetical protein
MSHPMLRELLQIANTTNARNEQGDLLQNHVR